MSKLISFLSLPNLLELCLDYYPDQLRRPAGMIKDPVVWLDGSRQLPKKGFKNKMSSVNLKI